MIQISRKQKIENAIASIKRDMTMAYRDMTNPRINSDERAKHEARYAELVATLEWLEGMRQQKEMHL